jgi:UDP-arabinose 4-epimerase
MKPGFYKPKNKCTVLVTGGAGYIGSHTCKALAEAGYLPVVYDNLTKGRREFVRFGPLEIGDINDRQRIAEVLRRYDPVAVMHFASHAYVGESVVDPGKYYRNNVANTLNLLEAMRDHGVSRIIFPSSCAVYGVAGQLPITEDHPQAPVNPYGFSKLVVEHMLADFEAAHGMRHVSLRYFNAAGADAACEIGECHNPETHLIPLLLNSVLCQRDVVPIFGTDYDTPDGTCIRDYIHVTDLADAHVRALNHLLDGGASVAFNLGNGKGFSVREVIAAVARVTGKEAAVIESDRRAGDPAILLGSAARIRQYLGWAPMCPDLDTMVATAWAWHGKGLELNRKLKC